MRLLQVGVGGFGAHWLDSLEAMGDEVAHAGLVDQDPAALAAAAARVGLGPERCFTDLGTALEATDAEFALVVVPPAAHREVAERCLEAGLPVLVEKPLAGTRADCEALVEAAARTGRELAVSQQYRYRPVVETARRVLASGRLGAIGQARVEFWHHHDFRGTFREGMEHPLLLDMAIHHFDLIRHVCGLEPVSVSAHTWNPPWSQFDGDASAACVFAMENGARVLYAASWHPRVQDTDWNCAWLVECERGHLRLTADSLRVQETAGVHVPGEPAGEEEIPLVTLERPDQATALVTFAEAVRTGRPAPTTAADNLRSVEMVLNAVEAAQMGRTVEFEAAAQPPPLGSTR